MIATWKWLPSLGGSLLIAANTFAFSPEAARGEESPPSPSAAIADEQQLRPLLDKLTQLSQFIEHNAESPQIWQYHLEQAEVMLRLAAQSQEKERENLLRMVVDAAYSAALLCPRDQPAAFQRLRQLPSYLAQQFPNNPAVLYAVLQEIQADCLLVMEQNGGDQVKSEKHRCARLLQFAREHPGMPEAVKAVLQAAQTAESMGANEEACRCYRYLVDHFPTGASARKAAGALWRLGQNHEPLSLVLPLLYSTGSTPNSLFSFDELRGRLVIVYFWTSTCEKAEEDFQTLRQLTSRYAGRGLEVVYVNMDSDPAQGRAFLSGRLTSGVHLHQKGGLDGPLAEKYGLQQLPQAFLVGRDGTLLKHSLPVSRLESELGSDLSHTH
jgi:TolA-binding protein/thiol-disulfide isomerase/thioredoxin